MKKGKPEGRPKTIGANLPKGVHVVRRGNKTYYYFQPGRSGDSAAKRIALGSDPASTTFWQKIRQASGGCAERNDTFASLIVAYRASPEWRRLRPDTIKNYEKYFRGLLRVFSEEPVVNIARRDIIEMRDAMSATIAMANNALSALHTLLEWAVMRDWRSDNPAHGIPKLKKEEDTGHIPWPEDIYAYVMSRAPVMVKRMAFLGRATGQRVSDLVRMCPAMLAADGIHTRISKLRDKRHFVPLLTHQIRELRSWIDPDAPPDKPFLKSQRGRPLSVSRLDQIWHEWIRENLFMQNKKITIHGLKVTAVCDRFGKITEGAIAKELGMSVEMVNRYTRFIDAEKAARESRDEREEQLDSAKNGGVVKFKRTVR